MTVRVFLRLTIVLAFALTLDRAPASACSMRFVSVFEQAEEASCIALGRAARWGLNTRELMRGPSRSVRIRYGNTSCAPVVRPGREALVFVHERRLVASQQSYFERPDAALVDAVRRWVAAPDDDARRRLLIGLAVGEDEAARHAGFYLADRPDLLASLTQPERERLMEAVRRVRPDRVGPLALALARTHDPAAIDPLLSRIGDVQYVEMVGIPLEILTNHQQPTPGVDDPSPGQRWRRWRMRLDHHRLTASITGERSTDAVEETRAHWTAWRRAHLRTTPEQLVASGFRERGASPPADRAAMAAMIRTGDPLSRVVALERCEASQQRRLSTVHRYSRGTSPQYWQMLATACETGQPPSY